MNVGMQVTYSRWLSQACDALHRMRCVKADSMIDFSERDPGGFVLMVDAMFGMGSTITPDVNERWHMIKRGTPKAGKEIRATDVL